LASDTTLSSFGRKDQDRRARGPQAPPLPLGGRQNRRCDREAAEPDRCLSHDPSPHGRSRLQDSSSAATYSAATGITAYLEAGGTLEDTRRQAVDRLVQNATVMGANAVLMMRFDQVRNGLVDGGKRIRTLGPSRDWDRSEPVKPRAERCGASRNGRAFYGGTESSNPPSSSSESRANPVGLAQVEWPVRRRRSPWQAQITSDRASAPLII
jgi:hypothetical protein